MDKLRILEKKLKQTTPFCFKLPIYLLNQVKADAERANRSTGKQICNILMEYYNNNLK